MKKSINITVEKLVDNSEEFLRGVKRLADADVLVGVPDNSEERKEGEINNAALLYIHDTGSPAANIPARPVMDPGIQSVKDEIIKHLTKLGQAALNSKKMTEILHAIGLIGQNALRARIVEGPFVALSPRTIAKRKSKGFQSEKPLNVTGQMRNAVTYVVEEKS